MSESQLTIVAKPPTVKPQKTFKDRRGERYGRLLIVEYLGRDKWNKGVWKCRCDCGVFVEVTTQNLTNENTTSCGCLQSQIMREKKTTHGKSGWRMYAVWNMVIARCENPNNRAYHNYGGRGIKVCARWRNGDGTMNGAECFILDMGERPSRIHSVDRIDVDGDYEPQNCRWATPKQQANNTRKAKQRRHAAALASQALASAIHLPPLK